jgi:hypothetical protein
LLINVDSQEGDSNTNSNHISSRFPSSLRVWAVRLTHSKQGINLCKQMSNLTGEGSEGLKSIFELFSIGFQANSSEDENTRDSRVGSTKQFFPLRFGFPMLCLPSDLHGLIYSYLEWKEKLIFIHISKGIYSFSRNYREMSLNKVFSLQYATNEYFRGRVSSLVLHSHVDLYLTCCSQITDLELSQLGGDDIREIDLSGCDQITDEGLCHLRNLQSLDLSRCTGITDAGLSNLRNLKELFLTWCPQITDHGLCRLGNLQYLNLSYCLGITDAGLVSLRNLKEINLQGCDQITDEGLRHCCHLDSLNLSFCEGLTDAGLSYLQNLKEISLSGCVQITDEGLRHLGNLQSLNLSCCRRITDAGMTHLVNLKDLNISYCREITDEGLRHLGKLQSLDLALSWDHRCRLGLPWESQGSQSLILS